MIVWLTWLAPTAQEVTDQASGVESEQVQAPAEVVEPVAPAVGIAPVLAEDDSTFVGGQNGVVRSITVENDVYRAVFSTQGGTITSFELKQYKRAESEDPVQLVDSSKGGALGIEFTSPGNRNYDSRSFVFSADTNRRNIQVGDAGTNLTFSTAIGDGSISFTYTFFPDSYEIGLDVTQDGAASFITRDGYELVWSGGIPFSEMDLQNSAMRAGAFARSGGEVESVTLASDEYDEQRISGDVDWVSVKSKYFTVAVMPQGDAGGAELRGEQVGTLEDGDLRHDYVAGLMMPSPTGAPDSFTMYMGPMLYGNISAYDLGLYEMVDFGWDFFEIVTRPLARFVFIPLFTYLSAVIPSYGLVIIIMSFLIKLVLFPLTKSSFKNMGKMKELQPRMEEIKAKYKDDPKKQQEATMKMYKETGVNPLGGCLPMLLQYPVIIALWQFLPQAIELRQQGFLWANDLSAPDVIVNLPFEIPFFGSAIAGFTLLMGISMVFQMKVSMTAQSNAQAKIFTYVMPVFIFFIFNKLASGLNLYYLCYNVLTAVQQKLINKQIHEHPEELKPKSKSKPSKGRVAGGKGSQAKDSKGKNSKGVGSITGKAMPKSRRR